MLTSKNKIGAKYIKIRKCSVCGLCKSENVTFHRVPRNEEMKNLWCKALNKQLCFSALVCSNHFKESNYRNTGKKKYLKNDAVPIAEFNRLQKQTFLENSKYSNNNEKNLNNDENVDTNSENFLSNRENENDNSEQELFYIYYLDEKQNVDFIKYSARHDNV